MDDFFRSIGAAGHHEERGGHQRPERQFGGSSAGGGNYLWAKLGGDSQRAQFLSLPPRATLSLPRIRNEFEFAHAEYRHLFSAQEKSAREGRFFGLLLERERAASSHWRPRGLRRRISGRFW